MPIILAIEPDRRQAAHLSAIVRQRVGAELILADTTERALDAIGSQVPDLVLVPALLSPQDDAALNAALRVIAAAAHVRTLTIPVFASGVEREERGGLLSRWRRGRSEPLVPDGCDPAVFADQISEYLREAAAESATMRRRRSRRRRPLRSPNSLLNSLPNRLPTSSRSPPSRRSRRRNRSPSSNRSPTCPRAARVSRLKKCLPSLTCRASVPNRSS